MDLAYKFTDTHVRNNEILRDCVLTYLMAYKGEFEFIRDCQRQLDAGLTLSTGQVRAVLNCMRVDPNGIALLHTWVGSEDLAPVIKLDQRRETSKYRPISVYMKATFNMPFILSTYKLAYIAHLLDPDRSNVQFYTRQYVSGQLWRLHVTVRPYCGTYLSDEFMRLSNNPLGRRVCMRCEDKGN